MQFAQILKATGISEKDFPDLSELEVSIFDRRKLQTLNDINYHLTLNSNSMKCFKNLLETLSTTSIEKKIWVKIGIEFFTIEYPPNYEPNFFFLENKKHRN